MSTPAARVLIADDHRDSAESLAIVLAGEGYDVRIAGDGAAACEDIENWRPCAALIDLNMPVLGGLEVARHVRERPYGRDIVLLALTGYARETDRLAARAAGFDAHLVKPVEPRTVLEWLAPKRAPESAN